MLGQLNANRKSQIFQTAVPSIQNFCEVLSLKFIRSSIHLRTSFPLEVFLHPFTNAIHSACSTSYSTCLSSGDESLKAPCLVEYNLCLVDFNSTITTPDCASSLLSCDDASNTCAANAASCKNTCSVALDICQSSGDSALTAPCQKQYESCLVSFTSATAAIGEDCVASFITCRDNGGADNTCSSVRFSTYSQLISIFENS